MGALSPVIASSLSQIYYSTGLTFANEILQAFAWRPPQWNRSVSFTMTGTDPVTGQQTVYVFDGAQEANHEQQAVITQNPIQTGADTSDHAYIVPPRLMIEILMSDSMRSFSVGQWSSGPSRSVSAYQLLLSLQEQRQPVSVMTRLKAYDKMMIENVTAEEVKETRYALRARVTFRQILTASVEVTNSTVNYTTDPTNSSLPQTTGQTITGQAQTLQVPQSLQSQDWVANAASLSSAGINLASISSVAGAGYWTSTGLGPLKIVASAFGH